jgi:hypothetical protein
MKEVTYKKVFIRSADDLPKKNGNYWAKTKSYGSVTYERFDKIQIGLSYWESEIEWYFIEQPLPPSAIPTDAEIKKWSATTPTSKIGINWSLTEDIRYREGLEDGAFWFKSQLQSIHPQSSEREKIQDELIEKYSRLVNEIFSEPSDNFQAYQKGANIQLFKKQVIKLESELASLKERER